MQRRHLLKTFGSLGALGAGALFPAAGVRAAAAFRDVLDTPALRSPLAARSLLSGLALAGTRLVAVGQRGHVLTSDDAGLNWTQAEVPVSCDLVAAHFPTPSLGWAVGHDGVVLHSTDGGLRWTRQFDGRALGGRGAETPLLDVGFSDASNGIAVGAFGTVLRTADGGRSWQSVPALVDNPKSLHLYAIRRIGDDWWVCGEQGLVAKFDGSRFVSVETPYAGTLFGLVGHARLVLAHGLRGNVVRSTDAGRSWQAVKTPVAAGLAAGAIDAQGRIVLVSQAGHALVSRDDGASFTLAAGERSAPAAAVIAAGGAAVVVAGPRGVQTLTLA